MRRGDTVMIILEAAFEYAAIWVAALLCLDSKTSRRWLR